MPGKAKTPRSKTPSAPHRVVTLKYEDYLGVAGSRVLACGEGAQCGHPGRTTSRKPRKIDYIEEHNLEVSQVAAGGVHTLVLTTCGQVLTCGSNERGAVPVAADGELVDRLSPVQVPNEHGKIVSVVAGAAFSAALTADGAVYAWGWFRDCEGGDVNHPLAQQMQKEPTLILSPVVYKIVKMAAGENHVVFLSSDGKVLTFGDAGMGQSGRARGRDTMRSCRLGSVSGQDMVVTVRDPEAARYKLITFKNVFAGGYWTAALAVDGRIFCCGLNNHGQLPVMMNPGSKEDEKEAEKEHDRMGDASEAHTRIMRLSHASLLNVVPTCMTGVQHTLYSTASGRLFGAGKNIDDVLGLNCWRGRGDAANSRFDVPQLVSTVGDVAGVSAALDCSIAWTTEGTAHSWGYDSCGQLGLGLRADGDDDFKVVHEPRQLLSAHFDGFKSVSASMGDNHCLILAKKE